MRRSIGRFKKVLRSIGRYLEAGGVSMLFNVIEGIGRYYVELGGYERFWRV